MLKRASDVEARPVNWLWRPYIPYGKVTLIAGDGETGKSWISLWLAAVRSRGEEFPFGQTWPNGDRTTMVLNAEDDPDDTVVPRLGALGAQLENVIILADADNNANCWDLDDRGMAKLDEYVAQQRPGLVVLDSINAWFGKGADIYRPNEVRAFMNGLKQIARRHGCAVVAICHLTKGNRSSAARSILGSIDFYNASRSVLITKKMGKTKRVLSHIKGSLVAEEDKIRNMMYEIGGNGPVWLGETELSADDVTEAETDGTLGKGGVGETERATEWLERMLTEGPLSAKALKTEAKSEGFSERTLQRARSALSVKSYQEGRKWMVSR